MADLRLDRISFRYPTGFALGEIDLAVPEGSFLTLIGPNGSGKTTLLHLMSGLLTPRRGQVLLDGESIRKLGARSLARRLALISSEQSFQFPFTVNEVVFMGRYPHLGRLQHFSRRDRERVEEALRLTRTLDLRDRPISQLSSGERQRVLIARAISQDPAILMLDEPNTHLDINHQLVIFRLLQELNTRHGMTIVMVLHDLTAAAAFSRTVALLHRGTLLVAGAPAEVITPQNVLRAYGARVAVYPSPTGGFPQVSYTAD